MILQLDPKELTIGDLEDFEAVTGERWTDTFAEGRSPSALALKALVYIVKRREDPGFTLDDARTVRVDEIQIGAAAEANPIAAVS